jgi:hypothetical protein
LPLNALRQRVLTLRIASSTGYARKFRTSRSSYK